MRRSGREVAQHRGNVKPYRLTVSGEIAVEIAFGAIACWGIFVISGLFVGGAVVFRGSVTLANRFLGASSTSVPDEELDEWIGYRQMKRRVQAIPEPGIGKGMISVLLLVVVGFLTIMLMRFVFGVGPFEDDRFGNEGLLVASYVFGLIIGFPLSAWIIANMLPTKFGRACLVLVCNYLIVIAITLVLVIALRSLF